MRYFVLLGRFTVFDEVGEYEPATGTLRTFSRTAAPERVTGQICGHFDYLGGRRILLFRVSDVLYLQVDSQRINMADYSVELHSVVGQHVLRVLLRGKSVLEVTYDLPVIDPPLSDDPTSWGVGEEDFDFGLFIANLSRDVDRQSQIYSSHAGQRPGDASSSLGD